MADRTQKALAEFVSEAQENIDALGRGVMRLESAGDDPDLLNAVFRAAHTLKGLSSMFGVERMARLAHALEDVLDDVRMGRRALDRATADLLLEAPEVLSRIIAEESAGEAPRTADAAARLTERLRAEGRPRAPPASPTASARARWRAPDPPPIPSTGGRSGRRCAASSPSTRSTASARASRRGSPSTA